jgi:hypothetical protein
MLLLFITVNPLYNTLYVYVIASVPETTQGTKLTADSAKQPGIHIATVGAESSPMISQAIDGNYRMTTVPAGRSTMGSKKTDDVPNVSVCDCSAELWLSHPSPHDCRK